MEAVAPYIALVIGLFLSYKIAQVYLRYFRPVWWQGLLIGFPAMFIGAMPVHGFDTPDWLRKLTLFLAIVSVYTAYESVKKERGEEPAKPTKA